LKLTTKLILAFVAVSLLGSGIIVVLTRVATDREFTKLINDRYKAEVASKLADYYAGNGSWTGVEELFDHDEPNSSNFPDSTRPLFFSISDEYGYIMVGGFNHRAGELISENELDSGSLIQVNGQTVGILIMGGEPGRSPMEDDFLRRLNGSIFLSAVAAFFLALFFGAILSRTITRPIRELTKATHAMADGNLKQQVTVRSRDEIGELAQSFNKMSVDLARSFNLRKQMTADIAHELRTPLSLIIGHAEGVHDGVLEPSHENFEIIREEAERLEKLVNDLRTLSLADAGELSVEFQPVDVNEFLGDIHSHYLSIFTQRRIALNLEPAPVMLRVEAILDPNRFAQVLNNILDNALHYTPENGQVSIQASVVGEKIQISIQDSGTGVSPEEAQHLFDRFYRVDESRTRDDGGSGLGLAIAKSIVEMHKGRIWAESEKGKGLKVIIELPLAGS
jgi:signal transduction histidine kinase